MASAATPAAPSTTTAKINYIVRPNNGVRPYQKAYADPLTGERERNIVREERVVSVEDIRGKEHTVGLDTAGFQYASHKSGMAVEDFGDEERIRERYYPESVGLIRRLTGGSRVVLFDHTVRRRRPGGADARGDRQPATQVHVDQSSKAALERIHRHLPPSDAAKLAQGRYQIVNLWRPISHPAYDWPLACCDYRSVDADRDVFPMDLVYPDRTGENLGVAWSGGHRWVYLRGMTPEEVLLIKCADSLQDGSVAQFTPHTSFEDPTAPEGAPFRQSIEVRSLVFYD